MASWFQVTPLTLPNVHKIKSFKAPFSLKYCKTPTAALTAIPNINPNINRVTESLNLDATDRMINKINIDHDIAAIIIEKLLYILTEKNVPAVSITIATNKLAPAETPKISGPAIGFLK